MLKPYPDKISDLAKIIQSLRQRMIQIGIKEGLTSKNTVEISQKLDEYIARYQSLSN